MTPSDEAKAKALQEEWVNTYERLKYKSPSEQDKACMVLITAFATALRAETVEACARAVQDLTGKDSGNWNRAIVYAVAAIRAQKDDTR